MHQVFAIFLRDVKRILKNPVALVVTLGVAIIPSLYAWCNILANWDRYCTKLCANYRRRRASRCRVFISPQP